MRKSLSASDKYDAKIEWEKLFPSIRSAQARKDDQEKTPLFQGTFGLFPRALEGVAKVSAFGAKKYSWTNWKYVPDGIKRYTDALMRHLQAEAKGEVVDSDTELMTAFSTAWNALARLELMLLEREKDYNKSEETIWS